MKNRYFVATIKENDKLYSYVIKTNKSDNILYKINVKNVQYVMLCDTKKEACRIASTWNNQYKENGTYLFENPSF